MTDSSETPERQHLGRRAAAGRRPAPDRAARSGSPAGSRTPSPRSPRPLPRSSPTGPRSSPRASCGRCATRATGCARWSRSAPAASPPGPWSCSSCAAAAARRARAGYAPLAAACARGFSRAAAVLRAVPFARSCGALEPRQAERAGEGGEAEQAEGQVRPAAPLREVGRSPGRCRVSRAERRGREATRGGRARRPRSRLSAPLTRGTSVVEPGSKRS